jgi:4'-phosphopantetheinyl transferase EntD
MTAASGPVPHCMETENVPSGGLACSAVTARRVEHPRLTSGAPPGAVLMSASRTMTLAAARQNLYNEERRQLARATPGRVQEFATGRLCARAALRELGMAESAIPAGDNRVPQWPTGIVGSVTHCPGLCLCVVAHSHAATSVGLDAEPNRRLPADARRVGVGPQEERAAANALGRTDVAVDRLLFSAKEAWHKAVFPLTGRRWGFAEIDIRVDPLGELRAYATGEAPLPDHKGVWAVLDDHLVTCIWTR